MYCISKYIVLLYGSAQKYCAEEVDTTPKKRVIGPAILKYLKEHGIKQTYVARKSDIPRQTFHDIMHGLRDCKAEEYFAICNVIGVPLNTFEAERKMEDGGAA
jgi:predicted transcriptional regulator